MDQRRQVYKNMRVFSQLFILDNRELKQRRFEQRTSTGSKAFSLLICLEVKKICISKFLFSYKDDLPESLNQTTA